MLSVLAQKSLVLVFAYAPAGFGHLRVADALYHGLPLGVSPILLGAQDKSITTIHKIVSLHPLVRRIFEWGQQGKQERIFTHFYRQQLRSKTKNIYSQMVTIIDQRLEPPETILVIATHFGLAHQIAAIKNQLMKEKKIKIILVVQVTDDSPMHIWYVPDADIIFVPSQKTKEALLEYGRAAKLPPVRFEVIPYPVSPGLSKKMTNGAFLSRLQQVKIKEKASIHVAVPISGAAVGMRFFVHMINELRQKSHRFVFHVISKVTSYTQPFLNEMMANPFVDLHLSSIDKEVVNLYEKAYQQQIISLEVTKPSEQAFKTLLKPTQIGGSLLLFANPVGRQEYDNMDFMRRHRLIPTVAEQKHLWEKAEKDLALQNHEQEQIFKKAATWRGVALPFGSQYAARFIWWCLKEQVFEKMVQCKVQPHAEDKFAQEIGPDGVKEFWQKTVEFLLSQQEG